MTITQSEIHQLHIDYWQQMERVRTIHTILKDRIADYCQHHFPLRAGESCVITPEFRLFMRAKWFNEPKQADEYAEIGEVWGFGDYTFDGSDFMISVQERSDVNPRRATFVPIGLATMMRTAYLEMMQEGAL